jgi:hypothetical protein
MAQNQSQFSILEALVISSTVRNEEIVVDVLSNIKELRLYENIFNPYIDASIVLLDDFGLRTSLRVQGTERLKLVIGNADKPEEPLIIKYFFFSRIIDTRKTNERAEILSIELVEEHVYINSIKEISKSYTEKLENIIESIASIELGKETTRRFFGGSIQGVRKIIVPYLTPIEAITWLKLRATTQTGSPLYLHGDLYSNKLILSDLDNLLKQDVVNEDLPLIMNEASNSVSDNGDLLKTYYQVNTVREVNSFDALALYEKGVVGSYYANIDAGSGQTVGSHVTVREVVEDLYTNTVLSDDVVQNIFDPSLLIGDKLSDEYDSLHVYQVTSNNTYNQYQSYHDETVLLDQNSNIIESRLKVKNKIISQVFLRNAIEIGMSGSLFFEGKITVGNKIRVLFLDPNVAKDNESVTDQIDRRKSGDFIILAIHHLMIDQRHVCVLKISKLSDVPKNIKLDFNI